MERNNRKIDMIADIFNTITQAISGFASALASGVTSVASMFYTSGENGGLTFLGTLLLIAVGVGVVYWVFRLIRGLIARRAA